VPARPNINILNTQWRFYPGSRTDCFSWVPFLQKENRRFADRTAESKPRTIDTKFLPPYVSLRVKWAYGHRKLDRGPLKN